MNFISKILNLFPSGKKSAESTASSAHQAETMDGYTQFNLAQDYLFGKGVAKNESKAFELMMSAAMHGVPKAIYNLGVMYEHGIGTLKDYKQAEAYYQRGADINEPGCLYNLGVMYYTNMGGVGQNKYIARELIGRSAQLGYQPAIEALRKLQNEF